MELYDQSVKPDKVQSAVKRTLSIANGSPCSCEDASVSHDLVLPSTGDTQIRQSDFGGGGTFSNKHQAGAARSFAINKVKREGSFIGDFQRVHKHLNNAGVLVEIHGVFLRN